MGHTSEIKFLPLGIFYLSRVPLKRELAGLDLNSIDKEPDVQSHSLSLLVCSQCLY